MEARTSDAVERSELDRLAELALLEPYSCEDVDASDALRRRFLEPEEFDEAEELAGTDAVMGEGRSVECVFQSVLGDTGEGRVMGSDTLVPIPSCDLVGDI